MIKLYRPWAWCSNFLDEYFNDSYKPQRKCFPRAGKIGPLFNGWHFLKIDNANSDTYRRIRNETHQDHH